MILDVRLGDKAKVFVDGEEVIAVRAMTGNPGYAVTLSQDENGNFVHNNGFLVHELKVGNVTAVKRYK